MAAEKAEVDKLNKVLLKQPVTEKNAQLKAKPKQMVVTVPTQDPEDQQATVAKAVQEALNAQPGTRTPAPAPPPATFGELPQAPCCSYPVLQ